METYIVRVNGEEFEVEIEKADGSAAPAAPAKAAAPAPAKAAAPAGSGDPVNSPMPGTIVDVPVKAGQAVKAGDDLVRDPFVVIFGPVRGGLLICSDDITEDKAPQKEYRNAEKDKRYCGNDQKLSLTFHKQIPSNN